MERVRTGTDRRAVTVTLSAAGHALVERTVDDLLQHEESLLAALTPSEREQLAGLLRRLLAGVDGATR